MLAYTVSNTVHSFPAMVFYSHVIVNTIAL